MITRILNNVFHDKRLITVMMLLWLAVTIAIFSFTDTKNNNFLHVGPSNSTVLMGITVDTWPKWHAAVCAGFVSTLLNDFFNIAIDPWVINVVQDQKTKILPYPKSICLIICQVNSLYDHVMALFSISLLLAQIDFFVIRTTVDLLVSTYGTIKFMEKKQIDAACPPFSIFRVFRATPPNTDAETQPMRSDAVEMQAQE